MGKENNAHADATPAKDPGSSHRPEAQGLKRGDDETEMRTEAMISFAHAPPPPPNPPPLEFIFSVFVYKRMMV